MSKNETQFTPPGEAFDADELFALARLDIEKGDIAEALWRLKSVTMAAKVPMAAFSTCGQLYARLGLWEHALKMFQKHLEHHPEALGEKFSVGLALSNTGRSAEAMKIWDDVLQKQPSYVPALYHRALARAEQRQFAAAKQDLDVLMKSAGIEDPYLKPAKELLQGIDQAAGQSSALTTASPSSHDAYAALAMKAYSGTPTQ